MRSVRSTVQGPIAESFGSSLARAGDIDGDGAMDFAVSHARFGPTRAGRIHIVSGRTGLVLRTIEGSGRQNLGIRLAGGGDADGDGLADVAAWAFHDPSGSGVVCVFSGADGSLVLSVRGALDAGGSSGAFGRSLAFVDDVDGDGSDEVLVGSFFLDTDLERAGRVQLF